MKVLFAAGGTGGHINPALSAAKELKNRHPDADILFVGTKKKMESDLVPKAGFDFESINISGFQRSFAPADIIHNLGTLRRLLFVTGQCRKIIKKFNPDVVVGFGGYVSGPVVRTAHKLGIKTAIHEQNAYPGKTNIALSQYADAVMLTAEAAAKHLKTDKKPVLTGLPVREELECCSKAEARNKLGIPENSILILSTGGSLGAESINRVMCEIIPAYKDKGIYFIHGYGQLGRFVPDELKKHGVDSLEGSYYRVSEYIYDMSLCMAGADLVISRAGASSLAEIQALGKASVLVPSPYVAENHQYHNAMALADNNAAIVFEQKNFSSEGLKKILDDIIADPGKYEEIGRNAGAMAIKDSRSRICSVIESLAGR